MTAANDRHIMALMSFLKRVAASIILLSCANVALAQSRLFSLGGTFAVGTGSWSGGPASTVLLAVDLNHDGKIDLVTADSDQTITVLLGDGSGSFVPAPGSPIKAAGFALSIGTADFNGDGNPDIAATGVFGTEVLLGDGTGHFTKGTGITGYYSSTDGELLAVADLNGDGKADLAVGYFGQALVFFGDGTGGFSAPVLSLYLPNLSDVITGDFNGDGKTDLALVGTYGPGNVEVFLGHLGPATLLVFNPPLLFPFQMTYAAAAGDFNGDGKSDILTFREFAGFQSLIWFWTGNTQSVLTSFRGVQASAPAGAGLPSFVTVGDFNGDGKLDWAGAEVSLGRVSVALGDGTGMFSSAPGSPYTVGGTPIGVGVADFNGDGKPDLAVHTGSAVTLLLNTGALTMPATPAPATWLLVISGLAIVALMRRLGMGLRRV